MSKLVKVITMSVCLNVVSGLDAQALKFGPFSTLFPLTEFNGTKSVRSTIVIRKSGTYDFKNVLHIWKGKNWNCNAGKEQGPQILRVEASNVVIKNFSFIGDGATHDSNGLGDPIHIASCGEGQGNLCGANGPKNVVLDGIYGHACEDMITVGTPGTSNITIQNSVLIATPKKSAWDKTVQINFGKDIKIIDNEFVGGVRCARFKPNTSGEVRGTVFRECSAAVQLSSRDADISPMKNGPSRVYLKGNSYGSGSVNCKEGKSMPTSGNAVCG